MSSPTCWDGTQGLKPEERAISFPVSPGLSILAKYIFIFVCWDGYRIQGRMQTTKARAEAGVEEGEAPSPTSFSSAFRGKQAWVTQLSLGVEQQLGQTADPAASVSQALFSLP